ncbi:carboxylic ester hydrolase [Nocardia neocaledoniensis NBRC 108232]|uniref:Carboxylic ester hydrolase n=1 Tax=Nocardia neocaledoniensis TaxID=236511 RepID=A0A317NR43_9NOCA|nr:carboxylesterase family protein [Nocardia neocaledoniensis]PWV76188.1 carboxylesterase type B [Nocardia neocaledoniensis]GEM32090.1 carboxylic ester hydrolase [Nocardia neocaledoniensis NBRC 108232]
MSQFTEIRTVPGTVRGSWEGGVAVFRGIPFAQPPVGSLRFRAPVAVLPWSGTRDALAFGPSVPQAGQTGSVMTSTTRVPTDGSAECLTLNVWTPDLGSAALPVMVWIQGGTYLENHTSNPHYDGALLARSGVVVVSMNYRVGLDGFGHIAGAPDNRGILDQIAALRWVRDNIAAFGGDPARVTVFGQSAGGACVAALLTMPSARGLFGRAICQSMPGTYFSQRLAAAVTAAIAGEVGARADLDDLARHSPRALTAATAAVLAKMPRFAESWGPMALTPTPFSPVVDGLVLPDAPWRALAGGAARGIDLLVGHTRDEFRLYTSRPGTETVDPFDHLSPGADLRDAYAAAYPDASTAQRREILNADWLFRMPSVHLAESARAGGGRAWMYELRWSFSSEQGASHCLDFLLLFGTLGAEEIRRHRAAHPGAADEVSGVSRALRADWVEFATTGEPGWDPYTPQGRSTQIYDATATVSPYPEERSRRIWSAHRFGTLDLLSG